MDTELLAQLCATMERIEATIERIAAMGAVAQQPLGFRDGSPRPRYIYCNRSQNCLWYWLDEARNAQPIGQTALTCVVEKLEFKQLERRGKDTWKMHLHVRADRPYILEAGYDSNFAKSLISSLAVMTTAQLRAPVVIEVQAADSEEVLFGRLYSNGELVFAPWDESTSWKVVAKRAIAVLNGVAETA